jgi:hypothetical protein
VLPLAATRAEFVGVTTAAVVLVGEPMPAFQVVYRDQYGNATDHSGAVLFKTTTNTVMGSIATTRTALGVVQATPTAFATPGEYVLSVAGIAAGNTSPAPQRSFSVVRAANCLTREEQAAALPIKPEELVLSSIASDLALSPNDMAMDNSPIIIPVVVHIVNTVGMPEITDAQVQQQLTVLNNDFNRLNSDRVNTPAAFLPRAAAMNVRFCLAQVNPQGQTSTGITRTSSERTNYFPTDFVSPSDGDVLLKTHAPGWNPNQYLNVWVTNMPPSIYGYATFPVDPDVPRIDSDGRVRDGVVVNQSCFGVGRSTNQSFRNAGRMLTHEVGHWLNLRHTFANGCMSMGDEVEDTPQQQIPVQDICPQGVLLDPYSCPSTGLNGIMYMNYMDYSSDNCMNILTAGQVARMQAVFQTDAAGGGRREILEQASNLCGFAALRVVLRGSTANATTGQEVTFTAMASVGAAGYTYTWQRRELTDGGWSAWEALATNPTDSEVLEVIGLVRSVQIRVTVTDAVGNSVSASFVTLNRSGRSGMIRPQLRAAQSVQLHIQPNPISDQAVISYRLAEQATVSVEFRDALQRTVLQPVNAVVQTAGDKRIDVRIPPTLPNGLYMVRIVTVSATGTVHQESVQCSIMR